MRGFTDQKMQRRGFFARHPAQQRKAVTRLVALADGIEQVFQLDFIK